MRAGLVHLKGRYVLGNSRKVIMDGGPLQGVYEGNDDCAISYLKPGFKALCWDSWLEMRWPLTNYVLSEYRWAETIRVLGKDGNAKRIQNSEKPLVLIDGTVIKHGYFLRSLKNQIIQHIPTDQGQYKMWTTFMQCDPAGYYLYASCSKMGDHDLGFTAYGRVCRFKLDGTNETWEEVFSVQHIANNPFDLQDIDINPHGDVVAVDRGHRLNTTLWKYANKTKKVEKLTHSTMNQNIKFPKLSPTGQSVSFIQETVLRLVQLKGEL
jgi:hypothetical protein